MGLPLMKRVVNYPSDKVNPLAVHLFMWSEHILVNQHVIIYSKNNRVVKNVSLSTNMLRLIGVDN